MRRLAAVTFLALGLTAGAGGGYWYAQPTPAAVAPPAATNIAAAADRMVLYYRDPSGAPYWSATPKKDKQGRDYLPVFEDEEPAFGPGGEIKKASRVTAEPRKILYYRNPMGLPDTSSVPKKDWMGMDYIPVYEGEEQEDGKTVRVSVEKVQRSGVRTEVIEARTIIRPVRAVGTVMHDESRLTIVTMRSDGYIEELFVDKSGQHVHAGEPLFRVYSPDIVSAQVNLRNGGGLGGEQRLRNFGVPESHVRDVLAGKNPMSLIWPSPASGDVTEKNIINGQKVKAGDELYRIADHSHVWVIADVAESDLPLVKIGTRAHDHGAGLRGSADRRRSHIHLSRAEGRNADGARSDRSAEPRRPPQSRHVRRRGFPDGSRANACNRCSDQRSHRQWQPPSRAHRQR